MTQYQDIYLRDFVGDTGQIPSTTRLYVNMSPDIIPAGQQPVIDYQTTFVNNYNGPYNYYSSLVVNAANYIYVRGYNAAPQGTSGTVNLYWAKASILLLPSQWIANVIPNANGTNSATLAMTDTGQVAVADGAFYFTPTALAAGDHYCLIAQVVTDADPDPIPTSLEDMAAWVADSPGIGWRNMALVSATVPNYSTFVALETPVGSSTDLTLAITCTDIPDGTVCTLVGSQPDPSINYSFTVGPTNQTSITPKINQGGVPVFGVPGGLLEQLQITATAPAGTSFPFGASIAFQSYLLVESDQRVARYGRPPSDLGIRIPPGKLATTGSMVLLGEFTFQFT